MPRSAREVFALVALLWLPEAEGGGLSSLLLSPHSTRRLVEGRPDMVGFFGRAHERGETPLAAETGEVSAEAELAEPGTLKQGPRLKSDEAALAAEDERGSEGEEEDDDRSAAAATSRVRPGGGQGLGSGAGT